MKKSIASLLAVSLMSTMLVSSSAFAMNYQQHFDNEATLETLEEARVNGPEYLASATGRVYVADPALDAYPAGTTFVYRSEGIYTSLSAAPRMNTTILVYSDKHFETKEEAGAYLDELGLKDIIAKAYGSVVLVTPIDPARGFGQADQTAFYQLQSAMCNINYTNRADGTYYADNAYYGGLTYRYVIGIDGGATFINNFVSSTYDYVTRIAGMLLVGGDMERIRDVASFVPVYMLNPSKMAVEKYQAANDVDAYSYDGDVTTYFNQAQPLQKVVVANGELTADLVSDVYYNMMIKAERNAVIRAGLNNASTPYTGYNFNQAPYSLGDRTAIVDGKTASGLYVTEHHEDRFQDIHTEAGEYLDVWYEVLPEEVVNGTAPAGSVPLILCNHGSGDDPIQFIDETGWLNVAGENRVALVAPFHQNIGTSFDPMIRSDALPALVKYMLDTYPALDASHVYASGYSMGGGATYATIYGAPEMFAAVVPMAAMPRVSFASEEQAAKFVDLDMPIMITTSTCDLYVNAATETLIDDYESIVNMILGFNEIAPVTELDFEANKITGFKADHFKQIVVNNEYNNYTWTFDNAEGIPMVAVNITDFLPHGLYQEYAKQAWNFMKHYGRDLETKAVVYTAY